MPSAFSCARPPVRLLWKHVQVAPPPLSNRIVHSFYPTVAWCESQILVPCRVYGSRNAPSRFPLCCWPPAGCGSLERAWARRDLRFRHLRFQSRIRNIVAKAAVRGLAPHVSFRGFMASGLAFESFRPFGARCRVRVMQPYGFVLLHVAGQLSQHHLLKRPSFPSCIVPAPVPRIN